MPNKILLDIKDLDVYYGGIHALHRINMVVEQGEIVSIIGANGAGKSTLLNTIAGDKDKKNGAIIFEGAPAPTRAHQSVERGIVLVPDICQSHGERKSEGRRFPREEKRYRERLVHRGVRLVSALKRAAESDGRNIVRR